LLGVRPEHADPADTGWALRVEVVEMLGAERLVYGRLGEAAFTLRMDATLASPKPGDTVHLQVAGEHLHWFDRETQQRV
jgi:sn-glycerol 3-phosphate transport system ATP-binding protein